jgi:glycosyltransferase involved in cell wall biosynthesis
MGTRVLIVHNVPRNRTGGMSRLMGFLHDELPVSEYRTDYFTAENAPSWSQGKLARFLFPFLSFWSVFRAAHRYDIINVHEPVGLFFILFKKLLGNAKIVVTSHGIERRWWELRKDLRARNVSIRSRFFYPLTVLTQADYCLRHADHVFCLNSEDRDFLISRYRRRAETITLICPGVSEKYFSAFEGRVYNQANFLVFSGTWLERKGVDLLAEAFTRIKRSFINIKLVVLGSGVDSQQILAHFPTVLKKEVICIPRATEEETISWLKKADAYVLPSLFEGTPLTLLEAMAAGLPVITTSCCGMKDVVKERVNGMLVPPDDLASLISTLEEVLGNPVLRHRLGQAANTEMRRGYLWSQAAKPVTLAYEKLASPSSARSRRVKHS